MSVATVESCLKRSKVTGKTHQRVAQSLKEHSQALECSGSAAEDIALRVDEIESGLPSQGRDDVVMRLAQRHDEFWVMRPSGCVMNLNDSPVHRSKRVWVPLATEGAGRLEWQGMRSASAPSVGRDWVSRATPGVLTLGHDVSE